MDTLAYTKDVALVSGVPERSCVAEMGARGEKELEGNVFGTDGVVDKAVGLVVGRDLGSELAGGLLCGRGGLATTAAERRASAVETMPRLQQQRTECLECLNVVLERHGVVDIDRSHVRVVPHRVVHTDRTPRERRGRAGCKASW